MQIPFTLLLQSDYGEPCDCVLTALTACISERIYKPPEVVYDCVEAVARRYGYDGKRRGVYTVAIKPIWEEAFKWLTGLERKVRYRFLKGIGWNFGTVAEQIMRENPVVLSVGRAGKYKNHAVTVIGFDGSDFIIADNWSRYPQRLAYSDIDIGATINYMG